jgi:hypothetical protein
MRGFALVIPILICVSVFGFSAAAQAAPPVEPEGERTANNAFYAEGLGPGIVYSLNYERVFDDVVVRGGVGCVFGEEKSSKPGAETSTKPLLLTVPLTVGYIGNGTKWNMLELGAGAVVLHAAANAGTFYVTSRPSATTTVLATAIIGYRFQPPRGGLTVRAGLCALVGRYGFLPLWPYASAGWSF